MSSHPPGGSLRLDIAGIHFELAGLWPELARGLRERFGLFVPARTGAPPLDLRIAVRPSASRQFLPYPEPGGDLTYQLETDLEGTELEAGRLRVRSYSFSGSFEIDGPAGEIELCPTDFEPPARSVENFLRVALAWKALGRGGVLLHASGVVREGRAWVFFGPSGAGKTTVARLTPDGVLLNDDCILLARTEGGFSASGVPFKGAEDAGARDAGLFPLAGLFRLVQARDVSCERLGAALAVSEISSSVPFVTERAGGFERVFPTIVRIVREIPVFRLRFRLSADFWPVVRAAIGPGGPAGD